VATRLNDLRSEFPDLAGVVFDAALAARSLAPCSIEVASARLAELEQAGLLRRLTTTRRRPVWVPPSRSSTTGTAAADGQDGVQASVDATAVRATSGRQDRVLDLLAAINASHDGVLSAREIGEALGLSSPTSRTRWITRARDKGLIASTRANPFDPTGGYRLTDPGRRALTASDHPSASSS
ncbi:MAG TPA: hypothetical protein VGC04_10600, partial [Cellulomonas sp.]